MMNSPIAVRISSSSSSRELVATHLSVSSACRFAQTVSADTRPITPASTISTQTVIRRQRGSGMASLM